VDGVRARRYRAGSGAGQVLIIPIGFQVKVFFLACVIVAGLVGAVTVYRRILFVQALPAAIALVLVLLAG
jgi:putative membrane protein